jgi:hypothetical protein
MINPSKSLCRATSGLHFADFQAPGFGLLRVRFDPFAEPSLNDRYLRGAVATDDVTDVFVGENVPLDRRRRRLTALTSRARLGRSTCAMLKPARLSQSRAFRLKSGLAAPKLKGLPGTLRRKDREASWPGSFLEKTRNFPVGAWLVRAQFEQGVVRGD